MLAPRAFSRAGSGLLLLRSGGTSRSGRVRRLAAPPGHDPEGPTRPKGSEWVATAAPVIFFVVLGYCLVTFR